MRLFVGNIPFSMSEEDIKEVFENCTSFKLITDRETGRSRGFGFVEYETKEEAQEAIERFHNAEVQGKALIVNEARPQEKRNQRFSRSRNH